MVIQRHREPLFLFPSTLLPVYAPTLISALVWQCLLLQIYHFLQVFLTIYSQISAFLRNDLRLCTAWSLYYCTATADDIHNRTCDHVTGPVPSAATPQKQTKPLWRENISQEMSELPWQYWFSYNCVVCTTQINATTESDPLIFGLCVAQSHAEFKKASCQLSSLNWNSNI